MFESCDVNTWISLIGSQFRTTNDRQKVFDDFGSLWNFDVNSVWRKGMSKPFMRLLQRYICGSILISEQFNLA